MPRQDISRKIEILKNAKLSKGLELEYRLVRQIIKARVEQKISQKELADRVKTRQSNISRLESCAYNPSINFLKKIAAALGMELCVSLKRIDTATAEADESEFKI
jgi:ribosome-binding protein aMBF1 (putative translation factor)